MAWPITSRTPLRLRRQQSSGTSSRDSKPTVLSPHLVHIPPPLGFPVFFSFLQLTLPDTGVILVILGQLARSYAMAHAGTNFSHVVVMNREQGHILVKTGIYAYIRHPSYFGFFWWGMGTQFMLGNPVCAVGYALALWKFFSSRIRGGFPSLPMGCCEKNRFLSPGDTEAYGCGV